ncbi:MAG TPA: peroxidase family protein, partial [Chitinophagaceae bacterium]|nr:peroxidase family protein [Chitinophagaceae bacterium]
MSRKTFLPATCCLLLFSLSLTTAFTQQKKAERGKLLMTESRPRSSGAASLINLFRRSPYRTYDGRNNNITSTQNAYWGAADIPLYRELPAAYGASDPKNALGGLNRPSPREISNVLVDEPVTQFTTRVLSTLVYQWGQFLDHEITLTPTGNAEYAPIPLPENEEIFTEDIPFYRSEFRMTQGVGGTARQQLNLNTSFIDGSVVYGSDSKRAQWLRTMRNGKLKTSSGNLMPYNTTDGERASPIDPNAPSMENDNGGTAKTFVAGDVRAAENPVLASIHTLFVREHNSICDRLVGQGFRNDELIYQT